MHIFTLHLTLLALISVATNLANVVTTGGADWLVDNFLTTNTFKHVLDCC